MPDIRSGDSPAPGDAGRASGRAAMRIRLRLWPAVLIVLAYLAARLGIGFFGSTNVQSFMALAVAPVMATGLLGLWWLFASRVPWLDRIAGLTLFLAALTWIVVAQKTNGAYMLAYALPIVITGAVAVLVAASWLPWGTQRWAAAGFLLVAAGVFSAMRVDTLAGDLKPIVSWRWQPTAGDRAQTVSRPDAHGKAALPDHAGPGDWPEFRGPARDGRVPGTAFAADWRTPPREVWRKAMGPAWSSFAVVGNCAFTQEQQGADELVTCCDLATGQDVWVNRVHARFESTMGDGPRATPAFHEGRLYTQGATGVVQCLDAATGTTIWQRDLAKDTETKVPTYGFSSSPLVAGDCVVTFSGGRDGKSLVAYHRASGEIAWSAGHRTSAYSSPQYAMIGGVPQVLMVGDSGVQAFAPDSGQSLWDYAWRVKQYPRCIQPLVMDGGLVMLGTTGTMGSRLLRVEKQAAGWSVNDEWTAKGFRPYFNDGVLHKGCFYGFDGNRLACIDIKTGNRQWDGKRYGGQLLLVVDMDVVLVLAETGDVVLVRAAPDRFTELARFKALKGKTWNHPVIAHGRLLVRNAEEAACYELAVDAPKPAESTA